LVVVGGFAIREAEDAEVVFVAGAVSASYADLKSGQQRVRGPEADRNHLQ
jgi:hypothetical protein